ncbi:MAG: transglycosylase SLT domain-containing protein [Tahibacter sp.]
MDESGVSALYARLDAAVKRFEAGAKIADGSDPALGQRESNAALDDLRTAALQCHAVNGCEEERFLSAFDGLLRRDTAVAPGTDTAVVDSQSPGAADDAVPGEASVIVADLPEAGRSITLLKGKPLADIIAMNGPVKAALEEWLSQYRPNLIQSWVNYQYLRYRMWPEYEKAGLPEALLFGMLAKESGGKVHAVSRSGASGPLQFMYATGTRFGLGTVDGFDQRFDPALSARANAAYLNEQLRIFNNDLELVVAAYNGGEGRMQRLAGGGGHFWDARVYAALSPETREYVPMVLAAAWLFMHPERYNLVFPRLDNKPGSIVLQEPISLSELSVCLGQEGASRDGWFRALRNMNAAFEPQQVLASGVRLEVPAVLEKGYAKSCVSGPWHTLAQDLHSAVAPVVASRVMNPPASQASAGRRYIVRKGDTLAAIARRHSCGATREIATLNRLRAPQYAIHPGQTLQIPQCSK